MVKLVFLDKELSLKFDMVEVILHDDYLVLLARGDVNVHNQKGFRKRR